MKILNIGSLNVDYVHRVDHIVKPSETVSALDYSIFCGGKGLNQSIAIARAGGQVFHAGKIGINGQILVDKLIENNVNCDHVLISDTSHTGHAFIQVDENGQNSIVVYGGANACLLKTEIDQILSSFVEGDVLLMQNEVNNLDYAIEEAHKKNMITILNPSPINNLVGSKFLNYIDYFILNEHEGCELTGETDYEKILEKMKMLYPQSKVLLTLGKNGCIFSDTKYEYRMGIFDVPVVDTTAAGDTFTGYFVTGLLINKDDIETVLYRSSKASSLAVSKAGASDSIPLRYDVDKSSICLMS